MKKIKLLLMILAIAFIAIQFFTIDKSQPETPTEISFEAISTPPVEIVKLIRQSCYDCHSNETVYPWYSNVAPASWFLNNHITVGREHLNFSEWGSYSLEDRNHSIEEIIEELEEGEMPLISYLWLHGNARLSDSEINQLTNWFKGL